MAAISSLSERLDPAGPGVGERLRALLWSGELTLPLPGRGDTAGRWDALAGWAAEDLALARLAEGHTDAVAILAEAGRAAEPGRLYGVWAARTGGTGAELRDHAGTRLGDQAETEPRDLPGTRLGDHADTQLGDHAGTQPGHRAGTRPGDHAGTQPGDHADTPPGDHFETPPDEHAGTQSRDRVGAQLRGRAGGTGAGPSRRTLHGRVRFCSGAGMLDRALVVAGDRLVDVPLDGPGIRVDEDSWVADGMRASRTLDVHFDGVEVPESALVGPPGFYTGRPGFAWGGAGVAAVWLGGATALLGRAAARLSDPDPHQLAHLGALHAAIEAAAALLARLAARIDAAPAGAHARVDPGGTRARVGPPSTHAPAHARTEVPAAGSPIDAPAAGSRIDAPAAPIAVRSVGDFRIDLRAAGADPRIDAPPAAAADVRAEVATARAAVESACRQTLDVLPRLVGVPALSGDRWLSHQLADLAVYLRQHHGERDLAQLGALLLGR